MQYTGKVWKFGDNISTDPMMPGSQVHVRPGISDQEAAQYCMWANRPGWAEQVQPGDIIVAGRNFGCGSSRPAPRMLKTLGIAVVVADSMSRLFFRNAVNVGFPVLICDGVTDAFDEEDIAEVDLERGSVKNLKNEVELQGEALPPDSPPYQILRAGGLDPLLRQIVQGGGASHRR